MGKRDKYIYMLFENGKFVDEGYQRDLAEKYHVVGNAIHMDWKNKRKLLSKYTVYRHECKPIFTDYVYQCPKCGCEIKISLPILEKENK